MAPLSSSICPLLGEVSQYTGEQRLRPWIPFSHFDLCYINITGAHISPEVKKKKPQTKKQFIWKCPFSRPLLAMSVLFILLAPSVTLWSQSQLCQFLFHWGIRELCSTMLLAKLHRALSSPVGGDEWESFFETQFVIYYEKWSLLQVVWMSRMKSLKTWWRRRQVLLTSLSSSLCLGKSWKVSTSGALERYLSKILGTEISQHLANYNNVSTEQCLEARRDLQFCRQRGRMKGWGTVQRTIQRCDLAYTS